MISGTHLIIYSKNAEADKAFFKNILQLTHVDVGNSWLIFGCPPAELAVHPSSENDRHEIFLMCADIRAFVSQMKDKKIACSKVQNQGWGQMVQITLPGGGQLGVYQPRHESPRPMKSSSGRSTGGKVAKKSAKNKRRNQTK
ncbi:MAG: VOC family protein [Chitinophagales bacterium]